MTKKQKFEHLRYSICEDRNSNRYMRLILTDCLDLRSLRSDLVYYLDKYSCLGVQLGNGNAYQWYLGERYCEHPVDVNGMMDAAKSIAAHLGYELVNYNRIHWHIKSK